MIKVNRGRLILFAVVIFSYVFFAFPNLSISDFSHSPKNPYSYLAEGFLSGHTSVSIIPPKGLLDLPDPYDPTQNSYFRNHLKLHDMSLYNGKLYLYFGPLPVITFFIPFKLITTFYPPQALGVFFFLLLSFLISFRLLIKIKEKYFPLVSEKKLLLTGLILGFSNNAPFLLSEGKIYEVAVASAFCFMYLALFYLYEFFNHQHRSRDILLFSIFISLSVAGRPHFALVCLILFPAMLLYFIKKFEYKRLVKLTVALFIPAISVGVMLVMYNYVRFHSVFEFGENYQLASLNTTQTGLFHIANIYKNFVSGFIFYFIEPFSIDIYFPFIHFSPAPSLEVASLTGNYFREPTLGAILTTPFILLCLFLPKILYKNFKNKNHTILPLLYFLTFVAFIPVIIAIFLMCISGVTQRYETDFVPYFILLSIICMWFIETFHLHSKRFNLINLFFISSAVFSIYIGITLGFRSWKFHYFYFYINSTTISVDFIRCIYLSLLPILLVIASKCLDVDIKHSPRKMTNSDISVREI